MAETQLPTRTATGATDEDAVPDFDSNNTAGLLQERLQAWKHMVKYLEGYVTATEKVQKSQAKEYEKILKSVSDPLKEGHHFDQKLGGVAGLFENMRANTQGVATLHLETEKQLKGQVMPILERLHQEIKNKSKELESGAGKAAKLVEKARNTTQKHIELLGQHTGSYDARGGAVEAKNDPYILQRGVNHRLNKQIIEENNNRNDLIAVQNSFATFEAHILQTVQQALAQFNTFMGGQAERQRAMYGDITTTAHNIPADFEWQGFLHRNGSVMVDPNAPPKSMANISFPNQGHRATKPLIEGSLERKHRGMSALKGYSTSYYVVTPSGYFHEFKDDDDFRHDPTPEVSLYLPDCTIGAVDGTKFSVKGKDVSGGKMATKLAMNSEFTYKAHTASDAAQWHRILSTEISGAGKPTVTTDLPPASTTTSPTSPTDPAQQASLNEAVAEKPAPIQTEGVQETGSVPASAVPASATSATATAPASATKAGTGHYFPSPGGDKV